MPKLTNQLQSSKPNSLGDTEAISHLKQAIASGKHWYLALLEAAGLWTQAKENRHDRSYCYLIDGEAFDLMLLAERLCEAADGLIPEDEKDNLLFHGKPPIILDKEEFKRLIGNNKYRQCLNYFYGITIEEALILAVQDEVRKERWTLGLNNEEGITNEVYRRIYDSTKAVLLKLFRREKGYPQPRSISLTELKEFTYWLFKYRLEHSDKARVASDTKKALDWLRNRLTKNGFPTGLVKDEQFTGID